MTQTVLRSSARAVSINLDQPVQLVRSQYHDILRLGIKPSKADQRFKITPTMSVGSVGFHYASRVDWRLVRNGDVVLTRITGEQANEEGSAGYGTKSPRYYLTTDAPGSTEEATYAISMAEAEPSMGREVTVHAAKGLSLLIESVDGSPFDVVERFVATELPAEDGGTVQPPVTPPTPPQPPGPGPGPITPPSDAPRNLRLVYESSDHQLKATWRSAPGYRKHQWRHWDGEDWSSWTETDAGVLEVTIPSPQRNVTHKIRVRGRNTWGHPPYGDSDDASAFVPPLPPPTPTGASLEVDLPTPPNKAVYVVGSWNSAERATSYSVRFRFGGGVWRHGTTTGTSYRRPAATGSWQQMCDFQVQAKNRGGVSGWTKEESKIVGPDP